MNDRCHQKTGTFVQKEIVVRIPVTIRLPDDLTRASFIRAAKTNHANDEYSPEEIHAMGSALYDAGAKLLALAHNDPVLLRSLILGCAWDKINLSDAIACETLEEALQDAISKMPDGPEKAFFERPDTEDGLFLEERAAAVTMSMQFGKVSIDVQ